LRPSGTITVTKATATPIVASYRPATLVRNKRSVPVSTDRPGGRSIKIDNAAASAAAAAAAAAAASRIYTVTSGEVSGPAAIYGRGDATPATGHQLLTRSHGVILRHQRHNRKPRYTFAVSPPARIMLRQTQNPCARSDACSFFSRGDPVDFVRRFSPGSRNMAILYPIIHPF